MGGSGDQGAPIVKRQVGGLDIPPDVQGNIQSIATNVSLGNHNGF